MRHLRKALGRTSLAVGILLGLALALASPAFGTVSRVLLLHTNDLHDHLRPGYIGIGGLPYVAGFVNQVRAMRDDVILLDAGDVLEKGDLLAWQTRGLITYEALARIGYDAITIGNHDLDFGIEHLRGMEQVLGQPLLLLNLVDPLGEPVFQPSRVIEVNEVRLGVIGMLAPRKDFLGGLNHRDSGRALAAEAERLKQQEDVHLVIALSHEGSRAAGEWASMAPAVDVFVTGHSHETLLEPLVAESSGAIIVSAGADAHWVGHLELEIDLEARRVVGHRGGLNLLRHDRVPVDHDFLAWLQAREAQRVPRASEIITELDRPLGWFAISRLAADVIRARAGADIGFYHPAQIVRNGLPAGPIDFNALFRISADRVDPILALEMTGGEITRYMNALGMSNRGQTQWSGFSVQIEPGATGRALYRNDLDPDRRYRVVMPEREYQRYLVEIFEPAYVRTRVPGDQLDQTALVRRNFPAEPAGFRFVDALRNALVELDNAGIRMPEQLEILREAQGDTDPNEALFEPRFIAPLTRAHYHELEQQTRSLELQPTVSED